MTTTKNGMIVLGNAKVLYQYYFWNNLLNYFKTSDFLIQGKLPNFPFEFLSSSKNNPGGKYPN